MSQLAQSWLASRWPSVAAEVAPAANTTPPDSSNQARLEQLALPEVDEVCELAEEGLDWAGEAVAAWAQEGTCDPLDTDGSFTGFIAKGLGLTDEDGRFDSELVNRLVVDQGFPREVAVAWAEHIGDGALGDDPGWPGLRLALFGFKEHADQAADVVQAIDALLAPDARDRPADQLRELKLVFSALESFLPYVPVVTELLGVYGELLVHAAEQLDALSVQLRARDGKLLGVFYEGAYSGGAALTQYLKALHRGTIAAPDDGIVGWVMSNAEGLHFATGERPPAERREVFGVDFLAADRVDMAALTDWFTRNLWAIGRYVWGENVEAYWCEGDACSAW